MTTASLRDEVRSKGRDIVADSASPIVVVRGGMGGGGGCCMRDGWWGREESVARSRRSHTMGGGVCSTGVDC